MTSPERAGALQPEAEEKIRDVIEAMDCACEAHFDGRRRWLRNECHTCTTELLRGLYLSAQVSALESVAKEACYLCREAEDPEVHRHNGLCYAGKIWDMAARLRAGSPEQAKG